MKIETIITGTEKELKDFFKVTKINHEKISTVLEKKISKIGVKMETQTWTVESGIFMGEGVRHNISFNGDYQLKKNKK